MSYCEERHTPREMLNKIKISKPVFGTCFESQGVEVRLALKEKNVVVVVTRKEQETL